MKITDKTFKGMADRKIAISGIDLKNYMAIKSATWNPSERSFEKEKSEAHCVLGEHYYCHYSYAYEEYDEGYIYDCDKIEPLSYFKNTNREKGIFNVDKGGDVLYYAVERALSSSDHGEGNVLIFTGCGLTNEKELEKYGEYLESRLPDWEWRGDSFRSRVRILAVNETQAAFKALEKSVGGSLTDKNIITVDMGRRYVKVSLVENGRVYRIYERVLGGDMIDRALLPYVMYEYVLQVVDGLPTAKELIEAGKRVNKELVKVAKENGISLEFENESHARWALRLAKDKCFGSDGRGVHCAEFCTELKGGREIKVMVTPEMLDFAMHNTPVVIVDTTEYEWVIPSRFYPSLVEAYRCELMGIKEDIKRDMGEGFKVDFTIPMGGASMVKEFGDIRSEVFGKDAETGLDPLNVVADGLLLVGKDALKTYFEEK